MPIDVTLKRMFFRKFHTTEQANVRQVLLNTTQTVILQFVVLNKALLTNLAFKVLHALVPSLVRAPVGSLRETFVAHRALEWLIAAVQLLVVMQAAVDAKTTAADITGERRLTGVRADVRVKIHLPTKPFTAGRTHVRLNALVHRHVTLHVRRRQTLCAANRADDETRRVVPAHVSS